jgi:hypothetical protein
MTQKTLNAIVSEGFSSIANELQSLGDHVDNGNLPILQAIGELKLLVQRALTEAGHNQSDFEVFKESTHDRISKLERRASSNGAGHGAAE